MAQALLETVFDVLYLTGVLVAGVVMFTRGKHNPLVRKFGLMAVLLGGGDAFHLVPRMIALWTTGLEANAAMLGIGKLITSVTMTLFYLILYYIWRERYQVKGRQMLTYGMWGLTAVRIALCFFPQNDWTAFHQPLSWAIYRNIPFAIMGILMIVLFYQQTRKAGDRVFWHMPLAIILSFGFYIPVVLWGDAVPLLGMLMIPKTLAYVWVVWMGWRLYRERRGDKQGRTAEMQGASF